MVGEVLHALGIKIISVVSKGISGISIENIRRQHLFAETHFIKWMARFYIILAVKN